MLKKCSYFLQLTNGCGKADCINQYCASCVGKFTSKFLLNYRAIYCKHSVFLAFRILTYLQALRNIELKIRTNAQLPHYNWQQNTVLNPNFYVPLCLLRKVIILFY
jgi:hypothetical protein